MSGLLLMLLAVPLIGIGRWGQRNSASLVPQSFSAEGQVAQQRSIRRGAACCHVLAALSLTGGASMLIF